MHASEIQTKELKRYFHPPVESLAPGVHFQSGYASLGLQILVMFSFSILTGIRQDRFTVITLYKIIVSICAF